jgi:hypothetical protein
MTSPAPTRRRLVSEYVARSEGVRHASGTAARASRAASRGLREVRAAAAGGPGLLGAAIAPTALAALAATGWAGPSSMALPKKVTPAAVPPRPLPRLACDHPPASGRARSPPTRRSPRPGGQPRQAGIILAPYATASYWENIMRKLIAVIAIAAAAACAAGAIAEAATAAAASSAPVADGGVYYHS